MKEQNELGRRIARLIAAQGPISIAQFITLALHDPRGGYYATRDPLGADFITAPEMTQAFGELLGLWCAQVWHEQGKPNPARLVELGPGRATLMADALRAARLIPQFLAALEVVLVETSPVLAAIQKETLRDCAATLRWVTSAADIARDRPQFTIANEFLDALPIRQFAMREKFWCERLVGLDDTDELAFVFAPAPWRLSLPPERGEPAPGAVYETCAAANALVEDLARGIAAEGGAALFIDYGHTGTGFGDTLQAVGGNRFKDVLAAPGEADLSAHVDFDAIARAARAGGAEVYGPLAQGKFLEALGIRERAATLAQTASAELAAVDRLTQPEQMGTLFKALAILPKSSPPPPGF